jgi:hypothetical protein
MTNFVDATANSRAVIYSGDDTLLAQAAALRAQSAADNAAANGGYLHFATYAQRDAYPLAKRFYGLWAYVTEGTPRAYQWVPSGSVDPFGVTATADGWVGNYTNAELKNLGNGFTGQLAQSQVGGLVNALSDLNVSISTRRCGTIAQRNALTGTVLVDGLRYYCADAAREYQYVKAGSVDPFGVTATADGWVGNYTNAELKNLGNGFTGQLAQSQVGGLVAALTDAANLYAAQIADFRARARTTATNPVVDLQWDIKGNMPASQVVSWGTRSVTLDSKARSFTPPDWSAGKQLFTIGNSLSDISDVTTRWSQQFAASRGVSLLSTARYTSDARQVYRCGAVPIYLTISGNTLPASGTSASIAAINGLAPSANFSTNPASFLNTGDVNIVTNCSMTGWIGDRHVTVSIPNAASTAYTVVQDAGGAAVALSGAVLFTPDISLQLDRSDVLIWMGNNYFYSGVANTYGDYTNPQFWVDLSAIVTKCKGARILMLPVIPSSDWATTGTGNPYAAMVAANARTEALYPAYVARDAQGRTLLQRLQANGNNSANDNADITAGFVPRSLHMTGDNLHLNAAGEAVVAAFVAEAWAAQTLPAAITQSTMFTLSIAGAASGTGAVAKDTAITLVRA